MNYQIPTEVKNLIAKFNDAGYQIYIVGGAVRDLILDREVTDWDFTTDATPEQILKVIPEGYYNNQFGTVGIQSSAFSSQPSDQNQKESDDRRLTTDDSIFEITTMRKEGEYKDSRHPEEVFWTDKIEEDLARRDFTINALALGIVNQVISESVNQKKQESETPTNRPTNQLILDPFDGQKDIDQKQVRAVGDPNKRFKEDALRLLRAIRIATQLNFEIDPATFQAIKDNAYLIKEIANERVRDELYKLLVSENAYWGMQKLRETGLLQIILPEIERCFDLKQEGPKHDRKYDIGEHSFLTLKHTPSTDPIVRLAALLHDVGKPDTVSIQDDGNVIFYNHEVVGSRIGLEIAKRFNLSKKQTDKIFRLIRWHMFTLDENQTDASIRRFIKNVGLENIDDMMAVRVGDRLGGGTQKAVSWRMEKFRERIDQVLDKPFAVTDLAINGKDVMGTLKIEPSRKVGEILDELFKEVLEDSSKNNREYLLSKVEAYKEI